MRFHLCLICLCLGSSASFPTSLAQAPLVSYTHRANHDPNGIGKFFLGREIARVMGHEGADWLERPERDREEHTSQLLQSLNLQPGMIVADVGAGTGYFSRRIARGVQPSGKVLAVDIQPEMLQILTNRLSSEGITNVVPILGTDRCPNLPCESVDLALMVDVYHELEFPFEMMSAMVKALKPNGRVVLVEYRGEDPAVPIKEVHKMTESQVRREMALHPLQWVQTVRILPQQNIFIFQRSRQNTAPDREGDTQDP